MTTGSDGVHLTIRDQVAEIVLDRPAQLNAITLEMAETLVALAAELDALVEGDGVRVLVLRGAGDRAFCTGADLKQRATMSESQLWRHGDLIRRFASACHDAPIPVIAAIHGHCLGGGLEIAVACDFRLAEPTASMGFTEVAIGAFPGAGGAVHTPKLIGPAAAKDMLLTGRRVSGTEAGTMGLARVVAPGTLDTETARLASTIAANAPLAVRAIKRLVNHGTELTTADAFVLSDALRRPLNGTEDYAEGLQAFAERRRPNFTGH